MKWNSWTRFFKVFSPQSPERYKSAFESLDSNNFNGDFAHKWRKKYPYYGRRKRSAE